MCPCIVVPAASSKWSRTNPGTGSGAAEKGRGGSTASQGRGRGVLGKVISHY